MSAEIEAAVREAAESAGVDVAELGGVGVGSPGAVDVEAGTVGHARNLPDWDSHYPLAEALGEALGPVVRVDNDVKVAVRAEVELGAGRAFCRSSASGGAPASAAGSCSTGSSGEAGGPPARSGTWWSNAAGRTAPADGAGAWRPTRAAAPWKPAPASW